MNKKVEKILQKYKNKQAGVFIDDANMFHAQREAGWKIDWRKFIYKCDFDGEIGFDIAENLESLERKLN